MGTPLKPLPVKLITGLISENTERLQHARKLLERHFGRADMVSPVFAFDQTDYYEEEFGKDLRRLFLCFEKLIPADTLGAIKQWTNNLETKLSRGPRERTVNIDPGYISLAKLVLATTKNHSHRIYVRQGIFEEVTLVFRGHTFVPLAWTYPDYRQESHVAFFNETRDAYKQRIEKIYGVSQLYRCV
ncbi:MAG: DUF4416 family protein [Candidatus Omnitrophica bacterium]|nr:DUF4416 family protein [Candidatus Omnitrophota bacterium]